jgi:hypothetical protein
MEISSPKGEFANCEPCLWPDILTFSPRQVSQGDGYAEAIEFFAHAG